MGLSFGVSAAAVWRLLDIEPVGGVRAIDETVYTWIASGALEIPLAFRLDPLSAVMILVITGIGTLIHLYSTAYMHDESDGEFARYFSYLNLFAAFMLVLVLGANFPVMFIGWEGVGLCSYLLIGFWFTKPSAADAGKKAFIVNRIGDFGFILGMLALFAAFGTLDFQGVAAAVAALPAGGDASAIADGHHAAAVPRRDGQVRAVSAVRLAAGRDGRPDAGLRADPRGDDGDGGRVHDRAQRRALQPRADDARSRRGRRLRHGAHGRHDRPRAERHQARARVLDGLAARLHVPGDGRRRVRRRHLPSLHARVLQGAAVPRIRRGHSRAARRAGPAPHGRPEEELPITYWTFLIGTLAIAGVPLLSGFFSKDEILWKTFAQRPHGALGAGGRDGVPDRDLHVPAAVPRVLRRAAARRGALAAPCTHAHGAHAAHTASGTPRRPRRTCTTRRRRWRSRWSCWRSDRSSPGYVGVPHALVHGGNRIEAFLEPSFQRARRAPAPRAPRRPAEAHGSAGTELGADGGVDARRARRHRRGDDVLPAAAGARRRAMAAALQRPAPAAAEQVLRRRDLRRGDRAADQAHVARRCSGAAWTPA